MVYTGSGGVIDNIKFKEINYNGKRKYCVLHEMQKEKRNGKY
jgi:hypothetical protein